jgi:hypothetical protein
MTKKEYLKKYGKESYKEIVKKENENSNGSEK